MAQLMKHVGSYGEKPCVVIFRELPDDEAHCLVVETGSLAPEQHDALMSVITSSEGQESNDISQVLHRRQFPDGSNMLSGLHFGKKLQRVAVTSVKLVPMPGQAVELSSVNAELKKIKAGNPPQVNEEKAYRSKDFVENETVSPVSVESDPALAALTNTAEPAIAASDLAKNLAFEASLLKEDSVKLAAEAEAKLRQAYKLDPSLKPTGRKKSAEKA
jgi:hypothetical protein